jgi:hypothetical protein
MSGAAAAQALHERFDEVRRAEWSRLGRKVASLEAVQRREVESIVAEIVRALAEQPARQLVTSDEPGLAQAALHLFGVSRAHAHLSAR